jgi:hypothetical protein
VLINGREYDPSFYSLLFELCDKFGSGELLFKTRLLVRREKTWSHCRLRRDELSLELWLY